MKEKRNRTAKILALVMAVTSFSLHWTVSAAEETYTLLKSDNFESYAVSETPVTGKGSEFVGAWKLTGVGDELNSDADVQIAENPNGDGNVVKQRTYHPFNWYGSHPAITPTDVKLAGGNKYKIKFDFCRTGNDQCLGLRFRDTDNTWTQLAFSGYGDKAYDDGKATSYSTAVINGVGSNVTRVKNLSENPELGEANASIVQLNDDRTSGSNMYFIYHGNGRWYTVEATVYGTTMVWSVTNNENSEVVQQGVYNAESDIITSKDSVELVSSGANAQYVYFDNFEISVSESYVPVCLAANIVSGQSANTDNVIKFNQKKGAYVAGVSVPSLAGKTVKLFNDGTAVKEVTLDENGLWLAGKEISSYKYIQLPSAADDVTVYGDMSKGMYNMGVSDAVPVYKIENGAVTELSGNVVSDDETAVSYRDGVLTALAEGKANIKLVSADGTIHNMAIEVTEKLMNVKYDDFEDYDLTAEPVKGSGSTIAGNWKMLTLDINDDFNAKASSAIVENPKGGGKVLKLSSFFVYNWYGGNGIAQPIDVKLNEHIKYNVKFDFYRDNDAVCVGLRFRNSDKKWKALYFAGKGNDFTYADENGNSYSTVVLNGSGSSAVRVKNISEGATLDGDYVNITQPESNATTGNNLYYVKNNGGAWYTVEAEIEENLISWTVTDKDGNVVQKGKAKLSDNFVKADTQVELFAGGANNRFAYFDNFEVNENDRISVTDNTAENRYDITVNPSGYKENSLDVYVAYYSGDVFVKAKKQTVSADGEVVHADKPSEYDGVKVFVWGTGLQSPLQTRINVK